MGNISQEEVVQQLGSMSILEMIALTRELEQKWNLKAEPRIIEAPIQQVEINKIVEKTEFNVLLSPVPADKKMAIIKLIREITGYGLKESKELVEAAPKMVKELVSKDEAELIQSRITEAGGTVEIK